MAYLPAPSVNKKDLENHLSRYFDFDRIIYYKKLKKGFANCLYYLKTQKGEYVLKISIRHNSSKLNFEINLLNFLKNLPIPKPIKTKTGKYTFNYKGHRTFIYSFLSGSEKKVFNSEMLFQVGEFLGKLHLQTKNFRSSIKRTRFYFFSKAEITRIVKESKKIKTQKILEALEYIRLNAMKYKMPRSLPEGAIHIDVKPENSLFRGKKLTGIVDFDNSFVGPLIFDLVDTIMWFSCKNGNLNKHKARRIFQGYESARKLTKVEKMAFFTVFRNILYGINLCCIDYLNHKKLPEHYIIYLIDNMLKTERKLKISEKKFMKIFY